MMNSKLKYHLNIARLLACMAILVLSSGLVVASEGKARVDRSKCRPHSLEYNSPGNGNRLDLEGFGEQLLYVDFWASWCGPCKLSFPFMNELHRDFEGRGLAIVAISVDENRAAAEKFLKRNPADFRLALDTTGACPREFAVEGMPSSYVVGKDGEILYRHTGFRPSDPEQIREAINKQLRSNQ